MEETRIDRLEVRIDELAAEMHSGFRSVDTRLCKIESRLEQTATKADLRVLEARVDQCATKTELGDLRTEMHNLRIEMLKMNGDLRTWMLATMITIIATFLTALFGLHHWTA